MAEPKRFDINKIENFLKNSADKAQTLSYWNAAVEHGKTVKEIDENLTSNVDDKQIADLLLSRTDAINRRNRLIKAVENAIKVKYQPQIPEIFSTVNKEMQSRLAELQQQSSSVGRVQMLMSALQDENQILNYLDLDEKKRAIDRLMDSNKKLREDSIANGKVVDEEDYAAACQELLQKRSDIKTKIEDLLKTGEGGAILRSLEDAEQRLADVRASVAADKSSKNGTSPQKERQPDDEQKEHDGHNADDNQEPRNGARSLPIEELSIHSRSERAKSNKTSVISKTSSARRVMHLELKALKEHEELQKRLEKLEREAKQLEREAKEKEIADLQEEVARRARIAEKEKEMANVPSSCGSSFRRISPVETPDDNLTKVSDWMDKTEEAENVASTTNVPSVYQQTSVSAPVITVQSMHEGQCSALVRDLNPPVKPTISTEAASRGIGKHRTKIVIDAVSQRATAQPEVKFAPSKPSMILSADPNRLPPTFGGIQSSAFQVPQLENTQKQYMPSQGPNIVSNARDDYYIRSSLPKLKLAEFSGDPLEWPEWSQLFQATVHAANMDDSVKMNHLKTMVTGKANEAIAGLGYTAEMYNVAWNILVRNFGKPQMVVNAQLKRIYSFPPMKPYEGAALIKFARIVSSCVNVLTQFNYVGDPNSEGVLGSATRKLTLDMKTKWLTYVKQMNLCQPGLAVFSEWLNDIADVQDELLLSSNPNADRAKLNYKEKAKGSTFATSTTNTTSDNSKYQPECALKDGKHPIWKCEKFKKMNVEERGQKAKELKLCFKCLSDAHQMRNCCGRLCDMNGCGKPHHRLLHRTYKNVEQKKNVENVDEVSNLSSMRSSGVLPVIPVSIGSGSKTVKTFALCDSGASLSFVDESLMKTLNLTGQPVDLNVAGIHGTSDISSERLRVRIGDQDGKVKEDIMAYSHPDVNAGNRTYNLKKLKEEYPHLSVLKDSTINLKDVKVILGQDCYQLHRAIDYRKCGNAKPWAVRTKLGWKLSGPLPQQETAKLATESLVAAEVDPLADQVKSWWSMKSYASNCSVSGRSKEDERALEMLKATTNFDGERYEVGLLWKNAKLHLPNNYSSAVSQLKSLVRRLEKDANLKQRYKETIDVDVQKGFVRILEEEELENTKTDLQWYVPHLPVLNPNKPDKVRRVCNAASKFGGVSLNDNLMAGPDLLQSLIGIIFRFREKEIALTADVEAMFLQVKVPPTDYRVLRFLWRENHTDPISVYEYGRHFFGAKSSPTCVNYALQQVGRDSRDDNGMVAKLINRNFYMDDFVKSVASREEAVEVYKCLRQSLANRGFQLTKWICNSEKVMEEIPSEDRSDALSKTFEAEPLAPSILGLQWDVESDSLEICRGTGKEVPVKITQRIVLSHVSSVFDPLGLFSPFTVRMRLFLKGIWKKHGQSWDEQVSPEDEIAFKDWASELNHVNEMAIKRKYLSKNAEVVDLHIFADASLEAMCMVAYFRDQQTGELAYVVGKCRVAPMKQQSIPRLELQAAMYGTRLKQLIVDEHDIQVERTFFWTDSTTVLQWLHGADKKQPVFVANRVAEILDSSTIDQWRHVEGTLNPADIGTRGKSVHELEKSEWFTGPAWLQEKEDAWPQTSPQLFQQKTEDIEQVFEVVSEEKDIDWEKFGSFRRTTRIFAYCLRFKSKSKRKVVITEEMQQVIQLLLRKSQMESFGPAYQALAAGKPMAASDHLNKLSPFMDEQNLMRLRGRLRHADASYEMKHPILLSAKHPIVRKLIEDAHENNYHEGTEYVRSILQQNYWIIGLRNALRNVKLKCVKCRKQ